MGEFPKIKYKKASIKFAHFAHEYIIFVRPKFERTIIKNSGTKKPNDNDHKYILNAKNKNHIIYL